ncbi:MAG: cation:proton antiporter [Rubrivivax sp.]|nr:cation:proton antiporter [Rubrivivax sp.]
MAGEVAGALSGAAGTFGEIALLLGGAAVVGAAAQALRQPLIVAFIVVGLLAGPSVLGWVRSLDEIDLLAQIGVAVLLFVVGLKLDLHHVRHLGPVALATGIGQLAFTIVIGFAIAIALGLGGVEALYVAVALTFSSTIIIVKLLSDKREIDSLHGRIAVGFLIVQDIAVVIAMLVVGSWTAGADPALAALSVAARMLGAVAAVGLLMRWVLPPLVARLARSQELLLLFGIAWGVGLAAAGELLGFSREVGAFLAGFSLASTPYREALSTRLTTVRDFLLLFFFVDLGAKVDLGALAGDLLPAAVLSLFVLIGNPLIVMAIMGAMGYRKRTGFMAGLTVAQISEFSIVFVAMGISLGHVDAGALGLVTLVGLVTITCSTYLILNAERLFERLEPWLGAFERRDPWREREGESAGHGAPQVLVFGLGRYGARLLDRLAAQGLAVAGVDFDPDVVRRLVARGLDVRYGDVEDVHLVEQLPLPHIRCIVSTLPQPEVNAQLVQTLAAAGYAGSTVVTAHDEADGARATAAGARHVLHPYRDAADHGAEQVAALVGAAPASGGAPPLPGTAGMVEAMEAPR